MFAELQKEKLIKIIFEEEKKKDAFAVIGH